MHSLPQRSLLILALALTASTAGAQSADWNRRISDVRIVHPPGTPPGTYRVQADVSIGANDAMGPGTNLGSEIVLLLNGSPIELGTLGGTQEQVIACYASGACTLAVPCSVWDTGAGTSEPGYCDQRWETYNGFTEFVCKCYLDRIWISVDWYFPNATDSVRVTIQPSPGSLGELATDDDSMEVLVGENVPGTPYCFGDGSLVTPCPCNNFGTQGHGCASSVNPEGALLASTGFTEVSPGTGTDSVVLHGSGMPSTSTCIYLKGASTLTNGALYGDGVRCVAGPYVRLRTKINVGGASRFPEPGDPSLSVRGGTPSGSGMTGWYQVYYRNPPNFCTPATFNISNGVAITW